VTDDNDIDDDDGEEIVEGEIVEDDAAGAFPDLSALGLAGGAMPDLGGMMDGLAQMQAIQSEVFEGSAGGGLVRIRANGRMDIESVTIRPDALEDSDADLVADLVLAALRDLTAKIAAAQAAAMGPLGGLLGGLP
jgi:nucleoid-associated protein EbfC